MALPRINWLEGHVEAVMGDSIRVAVERAGNAGGELPLEAGTSVVVRPGAGTAVDVRVLNKTRTALTVTVALALAFALLVAVLLATDDEPLISY